MTRSITPEPLTPDAFAPFGDVLDTAGTPDFAINEGMCDRFHDRARMEFRGPGARAGISLGLARPVALPLAFTLVERHPFGSQAFLPMRGPGFLVVVAPDESGTPGRPRAFFAAPGQGVNYLAGTWHGVLTPLGETAPFVIIDRIGDGANLEEYRYPAPWTIAAP